MAHCTKVIFDARPILIRRDGGASRTEWDSKCESASPDGCGCELEDRSNPWKCRDGCFAAGTNISMFNGELPIEQVRVGNVVKTLNVETMMIETSIVTKTLVHHNNDDGLIINGIIRTTSNHPFYTNNQWKTAGSLKIGDALFGIDGKTVSVISIERDDTIQTVYNLEIKRTHNYFADGVAVHNK